MDHIIAPIISLSETSSTARLAMTAIEVTDEVFDSPTPIVFEDPVNCRCSIKAILLATPG